MRGSGARAGGISVSLQLARDTNLDPASAGERESTPNQFPSVGGGQRRRLSTSVRSRAHRPQFNRGHSLSGPRDRFSFNRCKFLASLSPQPGARLSGPTPRDPWLLHVGRPAPARPPVRALSRREGPRGPFTAFCGVVVPKSQRHHLCLCVLASFAGVEDRHQRRTAAVPGRLDRGCGVSCSCTCVGGGAAAMSEPVSLDAALCVGT